MEGASGTDAVTPRAAAPMVAVPLAGQALLARSPGYGGTMPGMTAKVVLRGRNQEAYRQRGSTLIDKGNSAQARCPNMKTAAISEVWLLRTALWLLQGAHRESYPKNLRPRRLSR